MLLFLSGFATAVLTILLAVTLFCWICQTNLSRRQLTYDQMKKACQRIERRRLEEDRAANELFEALAQASIGLWSQGHEETKEN